MKLLQGLFDLREPARYKRQAGEAIEAGEARAGYAVTRE